MASDNNHIKFIGKYEIIEEIGKGGMGIVYKGVDPYIERTLAIKTIRFDIPKDEADYKKWKKRFLREAKLAGNLAHPNIVTIYDAGEDSGLFYIAMEYIEGKSLRDIIRSSKKIRFEEVKNMMEQICDALTYASSKGVIHCDIKPENILLDEEGKVYLVDFGIARTSSADLTKTMLSMVTPSYTSPERLNGQEPDIRSDIFALGAVMYEVISGQKAFQGETVSTIMKSILYDSPVRAKNLSPDMPKEIHYILERALAKEPEDRYQSYEEFYDDLKNYEDLHPDESFDGDYNPDDMTILLSGKKRFRPGKVIGLIAAILVIFAAFFIFQKSNETSIIYERNFGEATTSQCRTYIDQKRYAKAINNLEKVIASDPKDFNAYYLLGIAYQKKGNLDKSVDAYKKAIEIEPSFAPPYTGLVEAYEEKGDLQQAISASETYLQLFPMDGNAEQIKGKLASLREKTESDVTEAGTPKPTDEATDVTPAEGAGDKEGPVKISKEAAYAKGKALFDNQQYDEAMVVFEEALKNDPENEDIKRYLKLASHEKKKREDIALNRSLGISAYENKDYFQAANYFNEILNLDPENQDAKKYLARIRQDAIQEKINNITQPEAIRQRPFYQRTVKVLALDSSQSNTFERIYASAEQKLNRQLQGAVNDVQRTQALNSFTRQTYSELRMVLRQDQLITLKNYIDERKELREQVPNTAAATAEDAAPAAAAADTAPAAADADTATPAEGSAAEKKPASPPAAEGGAPAEKEPVKSDANESLNISQTMLTGIQAYTEKKYDRASFYFNEVLKADPNNLEAKKYLEKIRLEKIKVMNEPSPGEAEKETTGEDNVDLPEGM